MTESLPGATTALREALADANARADAAEARVAYWCEQAQEAYRARDSAVAVNEADLRDLAATREALAAALRAEHDDVLERAAQGCAEKGRDYERRAAGQYEHGSADEAGYLAQRASAWRDAESLCRALASPAAASGAEESAQMCPQCDGTGCAPNHLSDTCGACGGTGMRYTDESDDAPPSEPAAPAPCPGCVCADTEHRYCPICADRIQELGAEREAAEERELRTALRNIVGVWKEIHDNAKQRRMWILGWNTWLKVIAEGVAIAPCDSDLNAKVDRDALHERAPRDSGKGET